MSLHIAIAGVSERDIDLLLLEEFATSDDFTKWFVGQIQVVQHGIAHIEKVQRSVTQSTGESDLEVTCADSEGQLRRLLIENKISASFQPQQAERYRERGATYVERGECVAFYTVLVAPAQYFGDDKSLKGFDGRLTYEAIRDWFLQNEAMGERRYYKTALLTSAIEKALYGYQPIEDVPVSDFWQSYWEMARRIAPELQMERPQPKPSGAGFIYFRPRTLPPGVEICHKLLHGKIDLQFRSMGERLDDLESWFGKHLHRDMEITRAGKSGVIRLRVPVLNTGIDFVSQSVRVQHGLFRAKRLYAWFLDHRTGGPDSDECLNAGGDN